MTKASDNIFPKVTMVEGSAPSSPAATNFSLYYDSADHLLKWKNSAGTVTTIATGSGLSDPMTTRGDVIVRDASNVTARLAIGSTGKVLQSDGTDVSWQTPAGGSGGLTLIGETVLGSAATTIDISSISGSYKDLIIRVIAKTDRASVDTDEVRLRVGNGSIDTGANYRYRMDYVGTGGGVDETGTTYVHMGIAATSNGGQAAGVFSVHECTIYNYASTSQYRMGMGEATYLGVNKYFTWQFKFQWVNDANAIDIVRVYPGVGTNLVTGSRLAIWGRS